MTANGNYGPTSIGVDVIQSVTVSVGTLYKAQRVSVPVNMAVRCVSIGSSTIASSHTADAYLDDTLVAAFQIASTWSADFTFISSASSSYVYISYTNNNLVQSYTINQAAITCFPYP